MKLKKLLTALAKTNVRIESIDDEDLRNAENSIISAATRGYRKLQFACETGDQARFLASFYRARGLDATVKAEENNFTPSVKILWGK